MADVKELSINNTTYDIKAKSVVDQNGGKLRFWTGTRTQYDAIVTKDANTLYNITDDDTADAYEAYTKSEVDTLLNSKASIDLTNVNDTAKIAMAGAGMPSNKYIDLTLGASGTTYTAPVSGWVSAMCTNSTVCNLHSRYVNSADYQMGGSSDRYAVIPIAKGAKFNFYYNGTVNYLRIICSIGSESEAS